MKTASNGSLPLYSQIVQDIRNKILNGTYKYNERLPNEKWLCNLYDISRTTLRKSIDELIAEGLLERHSNKGSMWSIPNLTPDSTGLTAVSGDGQIRNKAQL